MRVGLLAEDLYRRNKPCYIGAATPQLWDAVKEKLEQRNADYLAVELRPEDAPAQFLIVAAVPFAADASCAIAKNIGLGKNAEEMPAPDAAGYVLGMADAAEANGFTVVVSGEWGRLVVHERKVNV